jgi:RimJ/RimL family protein N-acetyltransferase
LYGETIFLRPILPEDALAMFSGLEDEETNRLTGSHGSFTMEQVEAFCSRIAEADDRADYAIILKADPAVMLGEVVLNDISWENRSSNFRIALYSQEYFGKGYGTQATRLIIGYGFEQLNLHRIELEVYDFNPRAAHVYGKVGFRQEGVRRDALLWQGRYQNAIMMSILEDEYNNLT